jgi:hypothetical protein
MLVAPGGDGGAGTMEAEPAGEFIGEQGEIERTAVREKLGGKRPRLRRPRRGVIAAAGLRGEGGRITQPAMAQGIEPRAADLQARAGRGHVAASRIEVIEDRGNEGLWETVAELLFISGKMPPEPLQGKPSAPRIRFRFGRLAAPLRYAPGRGEAAKSEGHLLPERLSCFAPTPTLQIKDLERRAFNRIKHREARRQENIENIVGGATHQLPPDSKAQSINEDWASEFMNHCQDISDEQMQQVWSRILAGEFVSPSKYSLRTLNFVKLLSRNDAELFSHNCSFLWVAGADLAYLKTDKTDEYLTANGFPYASLLHLEALGLLNMEMTLAVTFNASKAVLHYHGQPYVFSFPDDAKKPSISCVLLTKMGNELTSLCTSQASFGYVAALTESLLQEKKCVVSLCQ